MLSVKTAGPVAGAVEVVAAAMGAAIVGGAAAWVAPPAGQSAR